MGLAKEQASPQQRTKAELSGVGGSKGTWCNATPTGMGADQPPKPCTYFVTTLILTPKTPVCFLDGVLFRLMSLLVNFIENSTLICGRPGVSPSSPALARHLCIAQGHSTAPGKGPQSKRGATGPHSPAYPVHLNHVHVPVLRLHSLRVQLRGEKVRELHRDAALCQPLCHPSPAAPEAPDPQMVSGTGHALPWQRAACSRRMERGRSGVPQAVPRNRVGSASPPGPPHEAEL